MDTLIRKDRRSRNFGDRPSGIGVDMLIVHYTGMRSAEEALDRLCDPRSEVSAHYLIDEDGSVFKLVDEDKRAWHAGVSSWRGAANINDRSIGIELVNPGHEFGYRAFTAQQMSSLEKLANQILSRNAVPPRHVLGHSDVAPSRKTDPGELFDWQRLAEAGIGLWPRSQADSQHTDLRRARRMLSKFGYAQEPGPDPDRDAVTAFQRHFRPSKVDGHVDDDTFSRLADLCNQIG